uniref:Mevalonate kinase n=1 Tax=Parastrongyloides trichosuri TaxID=131310 RepID=A0A0N4ZQF8_PARTI
MYYSAPGKIILFGEHAVVYGKTAIAGAIDLRAYVKIENNNYKNVSIELNDFNVVKQWSIDDFYDTIKIIKSIKNIKNLDTDKEIDELRVIVEKFAQNKDIGPQKHDAAFEAFCYFMIRLVIKENIKIKSKKISIKLNLPSSVGLGSSGAYCSSLIYGLFNYYNISFKMTDVVNYGTFGEYFIHGKSSGIDVSLSTYGNICCYKYGNDIEKINGCSEKEISIIIVNSKVERNTKMLVNEVRKKFNEDNELIGSIFEYIDEIAIEGGKILNSLDDDDDLEEKLKILSELCFKNNVLLLNLGLGHEETTKICSILAKYNITGKITGAGGGGCVFGLDLKKLQQSKKEELCGVLKKFGYDVWFCKLGAQGVMKHDTIPDIFK